MNDKSFKIFFSAIFLTTLIPYLPFIFRFLPEQLLGFNLTGWAWIIMFIFTGIQLLQTKRILFPIWIWLPWIIYLIVAIILDFTFIGLQLTLQYILPILIGWVASGFKYTKQKVNWLFIWMLRLSGAIFIMFVIGKATSGYGPGMATTPMLLSVTVSLIIALYFVTKNTKYLLIYLLLFLVPFLSVTRMGIAAFLVIFIMHFANEKIAGKIIYGTLGFLLLIVVFNSQGFQEKTFKEGKGELSDLSVNYYNNENVNSSGRTSWMTVLEPGLKAKPIWGNGPRADNAELSKLTLSKSTEAHNDYLSVRYNYGYVGFGLMMFGFITNFIDIFIKRKKIKNKYVWIIGTSALTLFLSFFLFMYSDNILKYTIYFPNYFYALIGIFYSLQKADFRKRPRKILKIDN